VIGVEAVADQGSEVVKAALVTPAGMVRWQVQWPPSCHCWRGRRWHRQGGPAHSSVKLPWTGEPDLTLVGFSVSEVRVGQDGGMRP